MDVKSLHCFNVDEEGSRDEEGSLGFDFGPIFFFFGGWVLRKSRGPRSSFSEQARQTFSSDRRVGAMQQLSI